MTQDDLITHMALPIREGIRTATRDLAAHEGSVGHPRQTELLGEAIAHAVSVEGHADLRDTVIRMLQRSR